MGAIKDLHDLTSALINSVQDRKIVADLYRILDAIASFQAEHFDARERNVNLLADNLRLQQEIRDLQSNHTVAIRELSTAHAAEIQRLAQSHAASVASLKRAHADEIARLNTAHSQEVSRLNQRITDLTPKPIKRITAGELAARSGTQIPKKAARPFNPIAPGSART